jgi:hypothetical protein
MTQINQSQKKRLEIINGLPIEENFEIPKGLPIPIGSNILIKPIAYKEVKLASGVMLPASSSRKKQYLAVVYLIGEEVTKPIREGIKIEYEEHVDVTPSELIHKGEVYLVISEHHIRCVVPPDVYKYPVYETNEEKRRITKADDQKDFIKKQDEKFDEIQNG